MFPVHGTDCKCRPTPDRLRLVCSQFQGYAIELNAMIPQEFPFSINIAWQKISTVLLNKDSANSQIYKLTWTLIVNQTELRIAAKLDNAD